MGCRVGREDFVLVEEDVWLFGEDAGLGGENIVLDGVHVWLARRDICQCFKYRLSS